MKANSLTPVPIIPLRNLKSTPHGRSLSPPRKPVLRTKQDLIKSSHKDEFTNDFIDHHKTFYTSLLKKIKVDDTAKRATSMLKESLLFSARRTASASHAFANESAENHFIKQNILQVIQKPPVKQFKYLQDDERIQRAVEPKRLIRGLDELYQRIDRLFVRKSDDDNSPRTETHKSMTQTQTQSAGKTTSRTPEGNSAAKKVQVQPLVQKKLYNNLIKDDKPEAVPVGITKKEVEVKTKVDGLEISFEGAWKKMNKGKLPQIRSSSQPRSRNERRSSQVKSIMVSQIVVPATENTEPDVVSEKKVDSPFAVHDKKFDKIMTYAEKGGLEQLENEENKISFKNLFGQQGTDEKPEIVDNSKKKDKKKVVAVPAEHSLPARTVIKSFKDESFILENYTLNRSMCQSLGNTLSQKPDLKILAFINNKLNDESMTALLEPIMSDPKDIEIFRCVRNSLGEKFISIFEKKFFSLGKNCLKELTLDSCRLLPKDLEAIMYVLNGARPRLKYLGLADVQINMQATRALGKLIVSSEYLISLDVAWNGMNSECMGLLLSSVKLNQSLRYLDLSGNSLVHPDNSHAKILKELVVKSEHLIHLNLSNTELSDSDATLVIEGVRKSKNVMAVHMGGNHITGLMVERISEFLRAKKSLYDNLSPFQETLEVRTYSQLRSGFISSGNALEADEKKSLSEKNKTPVKKGSEDLDEDNPLSQKASAHLIFTRVLDSEVTHDNDVWIEGKNCWICERWKKIQLSYKIPKPKTKPKANFDSHEGERPRNSRVQRMSADLTDEMDGPTPETGKEDVRIVGTFTREKDIKMVYKPQTRSFEYSGYVPPGDHAYKIKWVKEFGSDSCKVLLDGRTTVMLREVQIHPMHVTPLDSLLTGREMFVKEKSVFADFKLDDELLLRKAFEADMRRFTMHDFLKKRGELDRILIFLYKNFESIKSIFIHYAAISQYPYLSFEKAIDCLELCEIFDGDFKRNDVNKIFIVTRDLDETSEAPQDGLNRHNFMEALVKMALLKFNPKRPNEVQADTIEKFFQQFILKRAENFKKCYYEFRTQKIYTVAVDNFLKANIDALETIYRKKKQLFGIKIESLQEILHAAAINVSDKDLHLMAANSKMTIVDEEKDSKKYGLLAFVEFLEFIVRLSDFSIKEGELIERLMLTVEKIVKAHQQPFHKSVSEV